MHPNPVFHDASEAENLAFARERGFGVLCVAGEGAPMLSHVPFVLTEDGKAADLHLVRSNPIARALKASLGQPLPAVLALSGPDSYISPDWYGIADQVPTWNYVAVHLSGVLEALPEADLPGLLERLSAEFEARLAPKPEWRADKVNAGAMQRLMRQIAPFRLRIEAVDGTWKLGQNKPRDVRNRAAGHVDAYGIGAEVRSLAALMRGAADA